MFAVPGWSVSADALKSEAASPSGGGQSASRSRKRKRNLGSGLSQDVTAANVADLYESVIEGRGGGTEAKGTAAAAKRMRKDSSAASKLASATDSTSTPGSKDKDNKSESESKSEKNNEVSSKKQSKKDKKNKRHAEGGRKFPQEGTPTPASAANETKYKSNNTSSSSSSSPPKASKPGSDSGSAAAQSFLTPTLAKLTPLQASMREKLISARFRHLNETLYTKPSAEAFGLFQDSPEMFNEYHEGFRRQVKVWPENPIDSFLSDIRSRAKARPLTKGRPGPPPQRSKMPLPRTMGTCTIADLGCGDARLANSLQSQLSKLHLNVQSFDLQNPSPLVTKADIANLPLEDGSVNVAIFCLALMGTNWIDFIEEAYRVLHWKGELWIAEIKSRFGPARKPAVVEHSVGNRKKNAALSKKVKVAQAAQADALHGGDVADEVDGLEDRRRETDVSAFIEVLQKRGFVLQGERPDAVDLSNKMFVRMHFIKGAAPTKGKGVRADGDTKGQALKRRNFASKWKEGEDVNEDVNEASILKPCVYKIR